LHSRNLQAERIAIGIVMTYTVAILPMFFPSLRATVAVAGDCSGGMDFHMLIARVAEERRDGDGIATRRTASLRLVSPLGEELHNDRWAVIEVGSGRDAIVLLVFS
jgi:hypothetical protein